jgi:hypothetical protein
MGFCLLSPYECILAPSLGGENEKAAFSVLFGFGSYLGLVCAFFGL